MWVDHKLVDDGCETFFCVLLYHLAFEIYNSDVLECWGYYEHLKFAILVSKMIRRLG